MHSLLIYENKQHLIIRLSTGQKTKLIETDFLFHSNCFRHIHDVKRGVSYNVPLQIKITGCLAYRKGEQGQQVIFSSLNHIERKPL